MPADAAHLAFLLMLVASGGEVDCDADRRLARARFEACGAMDVYIAGWAGLVSPLMSAGFGLVLACIRRLHEGRRVELG